LYCAFSSAMRSLDKLALASVTSGAPATFMA
jgi:hypothetical protein